MHFLEAGVGVFQSKLAKVDSFLEDSLEALFDDPAAATGDWAGSIRWRTIVFIHSYMFQVRVIRSESHHALKVLHLLSQNSNWVTSNPLPFDSDFANVVVVLGSRLEIRSLLNQCVVIFITHKSC